MVDSLRQVALIFISMLSIKVLNEIFFDYAMETCSGSVFGAFNSQQGGGGFSAFSTSTGGTGKPPELFTQMRK